MTKLKYGDKVIVDDGFHPVMNGTIDGRVWIFGYSYSVKPALYDSSNPL